MEIELKPIDRANFRDLLKIKGLPEESDFVAPIEFSLAEAFVEKNLYRHLMWVFANWLYFV